MILVQLKAQVVPNDAALEVAARNGKEHFIFARLQQRGVESQCPILRQALVGIVANRVGCDSRALSGALAVADGAGALAVNLTASWLIALTPASATRKAAWIYGRPDPG